MTERRNIEYIGLKNLQEQEEQEGIELPTQVLLQSPPSHVLRSFIINSKKGDEYFDGLIGDIIIEYKECAGRQEAYFHPYFSEYYKYTYLKTYVSIGIPTKVYDRLRNDVCNDYFKVEIPNYIANNGYTWIVAIMEPDAQCHVYSKAMGNTASIGSLYHVMTKVKSNVRGNGRFDVQIIDDYLGRDLLKLTLTGFQLVEQTKLSSTKRLFPEASISDELKTKLIIQDE